MNYYIYVCLFFVIHTQNTICNKISAYYTIIPEINSFGSSLECLLQIAQETSVIKYSNEDQSCEILGLSWQTNPTFDTGYIYSWITAYERPFDETLFVKSPFPTNFKNYSSFDVIFRTGPVLSEWFHIDVRSSVSITTILHCNFRPSENRTVFDSFSGGHWVQDIFLPNPITSPNTEYRVTVFYGPSDWVLYVNNAYFYSFTNRHSFDGRGEVVFDAIDVYCQRIIYYPHS